MASNNKKIKIKCPYCDKRLTREDLVIHVGDEHDDMIPENFTPLRLVFNYVNKRPMTYHGKCIECGNPTDWDENKARYNRLCNNPKCKELYLSKFTDNMIKTKGVDRISKTIEGQEKMLAGRKISGSYKFSNGVEKTYTGSYELQALKFMDTVMHINPDDILCPGPAMNYEYEGKIHIYITDFYYIPYNLIIEVKDGGKNPNNRNMPEYRAKQIAKERHIIKNTNYNYLRLTDNDLSQLLAVFMDLKMQLVESTGTRVIHVNENALNESYNKKCKIYSMFAGVGKQYAIKELTNQGYKVDNIEKDITFKQIYPNRSVDYPKDIIKRSKNCDVLFIPYFLGMDSECFKNKNINYTIIYPDRKLKDIYFDRFKKELGFSNEEMDNFYENFDSMITDIENSNCNKIKLTSPNEYCLDHIQQSLEESYTNINEAMNALMTGYIPGFKDDGSAYIVNYMQNNVFNTCISDSPKLDKILFVDDDNKLVLGENKNINDSQYEIYKSNFTLKEISELFKDKLNTTVSDHYIYETLFRKKLYTSDQLQFEEGLEKIDSEYVIESKINNYLLSFLKEETPEQKIDNIEKELNKLGGEIYG